MIRTIVALLALTTLAGCADSAQEPGQPGSLTPRLNGRMVFQGTIGGGGH